MKRWGVVLVLLGLLISSKPPLYAGRMYDPELSRFATPDPALKTHNPTKLLEGSVLVDQGKLFSTSPYSYGCNNPLRYIDPDGRWSKDIHATIIRKAFQNLLPREQIDAVIRGSERTDGFLNGNQRRINSYKHAMRAPGQSVEEARDLMNKFIEENVQEFIEKDGTKALEALGEALHPLMDSTSPVHEGFQVWEGLGGPVKLVKAEAHRLRERSISPDQEKEIIEQVRQFYLDAEKRKKQAKENQEN